MTYTSTASLPRITLGYATAYIRAARRMAWARILPVKTALDHTAERPVIRHIGTAY